MRVLPLLLLLLAAAPLQAAQILAKTADLDFQYRWPAVAAAVPRLDARMRADAAERRRQALADARADRRERGDEFPFHPHDFTRTWTVSGDAGGLLALSAETYSFTGGAHGNTGYQALLWDRRRARAIPVQTLFADWAKALARLTRAFCPALDAERAKRRGAPVKRDEMFGDCPKLASQTLLPGRVRAGRFTALRVLIGPYEAGPYAEGSYEILLPVDRVLVAPAWRGAFGR